MKRNYIILLAALLTVACAGNGDTVSPTPQEGEILFSGSTVGPKVRTSYEGAGLKQYNDLIYRVVTLL